ncbi:MAG: glycine C-acetyltransferase [Nitrososphaerota archaeon]
MREYNLEEIAKAELEVLKSENRMWKEHVLHGAVNNWTIVDGKKELMLCTNDYLGLANNPEIKTEALNALKEYGAGSGAVRVIAGTMKLHIELERELAKYKNAEAAVTFQSGFATNFGVIPTMVGENDLLVSDELNHGSIIDGMRMSKAERKVYRHNDIESLKAILEDSGKYRRVLIVTDAVFSMEGDIAPLPEIVRLAKKFDAMTYVDDAHGEGVLGKLGRGAVNHFGLEGQVDVEMGTFSKAFGSVGGYVVGGEKFCEMLKNKVRPYLLSGSHPPAVVGANIAAIRYVQKHPELFERLWSSTKYFKEKIKGAGLDIGKSETPITPIMVGDSAKAQRLADELFEEGIFVIPIVYPMVPKDKARIRTIINARHTKEDLDFAVRKIVEIASKLGIVPKR